MKIIPVKKSQKVSVKNPNCAWKSVKKCAWKQFFVREKNSKKAKNGFHGHFWFSRGKKKHCSKHPLCFIYWDTFFLLPSLFSKEGFFVSGPLFDLFFFLFGSPALFFWLLRAFDLFSRSFFIFLVVLLFKAATDKAWPTRNTFFFLQVTTNNSSCV